MRPRSDPNVEMLERRIEKLDRVVAALRKDECNDDSERFRALAFLENLGEADLQEDRKGLCLSSR